MSPKAQIKVAIVNGASGQDGFFLTERLLADGWFVHATTRRKSIPDLVIAAHDFKSQLEIHQMDLLEPRLIGDLIKRIQPDEIYNLAGQSSVSQSFSEPFYTWQTNAESVAQMLEYIRKYSQHSRFYQASSTDMFGTPQVEATVFNEDSALNPQSPYASAKAAAHLLCHSYRQVYNLRIASGILSNHESHRRPASFLSRKVVDHVRKLKELSSSQLNSSSPLTVGNLKVQRDWGFAPDYVEGMLRIMRQIECRAQVESNGVEADEARNYRDYVLATGTTHAVWELIDCAFTIADFALEWDLEGPDPAAWKAVFRSNGMPAVVVNPKFLRAAEPLVIGVDPGRAQRELGWAPRQGLEVFLKDMFSRTLDSDATAENATA
jgi:GDPmannose 4,6-dehydratase